MTFSPNRREFLYGLGSTIGTVALNHMLQADQPASSTPQSPLAVRQPHVPATARACIFLCLEGGPSHIDTFDPKPRLNELHLQSYRNEGNDFSPMTSGERFFVGSPFRFRRAGRSGIAMCEHYHHLANVADELCIYRGCQAESVNHPTALFHLNTGNRFGGDPAIGSWVTYGLGSVNQNLPGYIVLSELAHPQGGADNWSNGFLPAHYQGTPLRAEGAPILDLRPQPWRTQQHQRTNLDVLNQLNQLHQQRHPGHEELAARMENYELAFRMQMQVPDIIDLSRESRATQQMYGLDREETAAFGRKCLLARRLVEQGVRFIQIFSGGWDSHDYLQRAHTARIRSLDQPLAALIRDLRQRGLLDQTLIVGCGEFGRTPGNNNRGGGIAIGRDHNAEAMSIFMAGGGVKSGHVIGATDEIGRRAVEVVHPLKDFHVTLLRLFGLDDNRLTYFHGGRFKQLSQTGGEVIEELIA